jgi:hypothetical protein
MLMVIVNPLLSWKECWWMLILSWPWELACEKAIIEMQNAKIICP